VRQHIALCRQSSIISPEVIFSKTMKRSAEQLRRDAIQIWQAGLEAVRSDRLVRDAVRVENNILRIGDDEINLTEVRRIVVVGAGKAGAGMADGLEQALGPQVLADKHVTGWVNVPDDCVRSLQTVHLHGARPAGINEPTEAGVHGATEIRRLVESFSSDDLCFVLVSGGASALLPDPVEGVSLADKLAVTRFLSGAGANIEELNTVRKQLSRLKGGSLAQACRAGKLYALIISDVLGDPLDVIGSGLTAPNPSTVDDALAVLKKFAARSMAVAPNVITYLESQRGKPDRRGLAHFASSEQNVPVPFSVDDRRGSTREVHNLVIGNNALAVDAAGAEAERLGYSHAMMSAKQSEGPAETVGHHLATMAFHMRDHAGPDCLISGGEPVVKLASPEKRGRGGRNQQLVLAAMQQLVEAGSEGVVLLSAGTDGEDGPTDAAGAVCDAAIIAEAKRLNLDLTDYLARNDAYTLFDQVGGLIKTGPTHTNVCDIRVVVVERAK
jgi:glycerate 2-kinase